MGRVLGAVLPAFVMAAAALAAQGPMKGPFPGVSNYTRVDATVACGGATTVEAYPELKKQGFKAVINLRQADEPGANIEASREAATAAGITYLHIPFNGRNPQAETVDAFLKAVKDPAHSPVLIHCGSANRVGGLWLVKRLLVDGWPEDKAVAEAETIGLSSPALKQFALDYVKAHRP